MSKGSIYKSLTGKDGLAAAERTNNFIRVGGQGGFSKHAETAAANTKSKRFSDVMSRGFGTYQNAAAEEGRSALGLAGKHAIQGAAAGAGIGGTIEAVQGGSFWDGAKQGAFNGAVGFTAIRSVKRAAGATGYVGQGGIRQSAGNMVRSTSNDVEISRQASSLLNQKQRDGMTRAFMNQNSKARG